MFIPTYIQLLPWLFGESIFLFGLFQAIFSRSERISFQVTVLYFLTKTPMPSPSSTLILSPYLKYIFVTSPHFKLLVYAMKSSPCPSLGVVYFYNKNPQYNKLSFCNTEDSTSFFKFLCYWYLLSIIYSN